MDTIFIDGIFKYNFLNENYCILYLRFASAFQNRSPLVQVMVRTFFSKFNLLDTRTRYKWAHGWVIKFHSFMLMQLLIHLLKTVLV